MAEDRIFQLSLAVLFILTVALAGLWDAWVIFRGRPELMVSAVVLEWTTRAPILLLAVGVVIGHLFWPQKIK